MDEATVICEVGAYDLFYERETKTFIKQPACGGRFNKKRDEIEREKMRKKRK